MAGTPRTSASADYMPRFYEYLPRAQTGVSAEELLERLEQSAEWKRAFAPKSIESALDEINRRAAVRLVDRSRSNSTVARFRLVPAVGEAKG